MEDIVGNIERRPISMARLFGRIAVMAAQALHIFVRPEHGGDHHLVERNALRCQTVQECTANLVEQARSTRHKIGNGMRKMLNIIERTRANIDELRPALRGLLAVGTTLYAQTLRRG